MSAPSRFLNCASLVTTLVAAGALFAPDPVEAEDTGYSGLDDEIETLWASQPLDESIR